MSLRLAWFAMLLVMAVSAPAAERLAYLGNWSNGRGETLVITAKTLQFADDRAVPYKDITRATDGSRFELQITARGAVNGFDGKFVSLECDGDSMKMITFASHADYMSDENPLAEVTWFEDDKGADD